ncbi:putative rod shape-determining protein MreC [Selenomonas ruminantium subsp. lactilytica TAM6421]|uniref:Cell shape-determining protein MreC n=1 Tax=Selenomonas ruminantium subsp. lactilytica (strain NBRC 103574 / TAM6421) TaxID=927704 RepID=I0GTM4_SELRL|nr:rod shape-determining protein MreC [Selenomonas ruminantium]BAL84111.1 putative rod shape-determining protein MreC [Selenomonas ruminantium subsp. lactilytica TAM6421]
MSNRVRRDKEDGRKGWAMVFVTISLFCIIFFAARGRFQAPVSSQAVSLVLSPFQQAVSWVANEVHYVTGAVWEMATLYEQNKMLRNEVEQLRGINLQANEALAENERLRAMVGYTQSARQFDMVAARVIGRESDTWSRMIVIDRGTASGVKEDMPVVTPQGLVGRVVEAGPNSSKVQLILDPRSSVGTIVQRAESRVTGIVQGDMDNPTMPQMVNIPKNADVVEGDVIVTSGFGGIFPKGIIVGLVSSLKNDDGGLLKIGVLESAVDFQKLEDVLVITASREAPPEPIKPPPQTPGTETDPQAQAADKAEAQQ